MSFCCTRASASSVYVPAEKVTLTLETEIDEKVFVWKGHLNVQDLAGRTSRMVLAAALGISPALAAESSFVMKGMLEEDQVSFLNTLSQALREKLQSRTGTVSLALVDTQPSDIFRAAIAKVTPDSQKLLLGSLSSLSINFSDRAESGCRVHMVGHRAICFGDTQEVE